MKLRHFVFALFATVTLMALACADSHKTDADKKAAVEALRQADNAWSASAEAQDMEKFHSTFLDDAKVLAPNAPAAEGKAAASAAFNNLFALPGFSVKWQPSDVVVSSSGDLGYTMGTYELGFDGPNGNPIVDNGKYMTVWKKGADGSWKVAVDMFNTNTPLPTAEDEG